MNKGGIMIYLLRHGLDDERFIGGYSDVTLEEEGIRQIKDARDFIIRNNLNIDKIYSSDIKRAKQSAEIINERINVPIIYTKELRELDKGDLTGLEKYYAYRKYPEFNNLKDVLKRYPNGESMQDLYDRVNLLLQKLKDNNSLFVTHRGVINMFYYILNNIKLDMDKKKFNVTHGSIHKLDINNKKIKRIF